MTDPDLELAITQARIAFAEARTSFALQASWVHLKLLTEQRTPSMVRKMDQEIRAT